MDPEYAAPWDAIKYFQAPLVTVVSLSASKATQLCAFNPRRVGLILSLNGAAGTVWIAPVDSVNSNGPGIPITTTFQYITFIQAEWGPLVNSAWFAALGSGSVTVIEVLLTDWPQDRSGNGQVLRMLDAARAAGNFGGNVVNPDSAKQP